jgi:hypothetical protein
MMKVLWPFGVALRGEASNHLKLRWLKTVVVSVEEKASERRQVGIGKASESEPLTTCRNKQLTSKPGRLNGAGMSLAGARLLARWCPAWRRRESGLRLLYGTWEGECRYGRLGLEWLRRREGAHRAAETVRR